MATCLVTISIFPTAKRQFTDGAGQELSGLAAVRANATRQVREIKAAMCDPHIQDLSGWSMTVADASGKNVFEISFEREPAAKA